MATNNSYSAATGASNRQISGSLLINDVGNGLTVTAYTNPSNGTVTVNSDGLFVYTPDANFSGTDSFDYTVTDAFGRSVSATVTLSVTVATSPVAPDTGFGVVHSPYPVLTELGNITLLVIFGFYRLLRKHA